MLPTRQLGNTSLHLTVVGIGTWAIGGGNWKFGWGDQDDQDAVDAIVAGVAAGVNWIDTAPVYGNGHSEELVGRALQQIDPARRPLVATKFGRAFQPDGNIVGILKRERVISECESSLRRLGVDAIDLLQMHWPDPDLDIEEAWQAMVELKHQGKVREIGVSNHSVEQLRRLQAIHPVASLQPPYSLLARQIEADVLGYCAEQQIGVIGYSPMGKGLLTGRFDRQRALSLPDSDHRSRDPKFQEPLLSINLEFVDRLRPIAERVNLSLAQLSIAWVLRRSEVTAAIVGARRPDQIEAIAAASHWDLSSEATEEIEQCLRDRQASLDALGPLDTGRV